MESARKRTKTLGNGIPVVEATGWQAFGAWALDFSLVAVLAAVASAAVAGQIHFRRHSRTHRAAQGRKGPGHLLGLPAFPGDEHPDRTAPVEPDPFWSFRRVLVFDRGPLYGYAQKRTARAIFWQDIDPASLRTVEASGPGFFTFSTVRTPDRLVTEIQRAMAESGIHRAGSPRAACGASARPDQLGNPA